MDGLLPKLLKDKKGVGLVVPAFEFTTFRYHGMVEEYPTTKEEVIDMIHQGKLDKFHATWERGHGPTNYTRWFTADEVYPVTEYNYDYEPYVIMRKDEVPWYVPFFVNCNEG
jgi:glycosyltransferase-like protein LARGE